MTDPEQHDTAESVLAEQAGRLEARLTGTLGKQRAVRWYKAATGARRPFKSAVSGVDRGRATAAAQLRRAARGQAGSRGAALSLSGTIPDYLRELGC